MASATGRASSTASGGGFAADIVGAVFQPLVKIDPRRYEMAVREADATVAARREDVAKSEADLKQQDLVIAQAEADRENAEANADLARKELDRTSPPCGARRSDAAAGRREGKRGQSGALDDPAEEGGGRCIPPGRSRRSAQ
jgi:hypothetical protein